MPRRASAQDMGIVRRDIRKGGVEFPLQGLGPMSEKSKGEADRKPAGSAKSRDIRLAEALRANLLKRKAQVRARSSSKRCDEGGQGKA